MRTWLLGAALVLGILPLACGDDSEPGDEPRGGGDSGAAGAPSPGPEPVAGAGGDVSGSGGAPSAAGQSSAGGAEEAGGAGGAGEPLPEPPNVVFVTSGQYLMKDLGGLEGADATCNELAADAGLEGNFVAWLSTSEVDAKDRLGDASGWVNTKGKPFARTVDELLDGNVIYYPVLYDENGEPAYGYAIATGTSEDGIAGDNCNDWTSDAPSDLLLAGNPTAASPYWTTNFSDFSCGDGYRLYCFQTDHRVALSPTPTQGRTVFVSSENFTPGPGGLESADALCAADAKANDLKGTFIALLDTFPDAFSRLIDPGRPWVRPDGMVVADSTGALIKGPLQVAISQLADGTYVGGEPVFGTDDWANASYTCGGWTDPQGSARWGLVGQTLRDWYDIDFGECSGARVICVQR
jgi:hypothetical protein